MSGKRNGCPMMDSGLPFESGDDGSPQNRLQANGKNKRGPVGPLSGCVLAVSLEDDFPGELDSARLTGEDLLLLVELRVSDRVEVTRSG